MNEATTILSGAWDEITYGIGEIFTNQYAALGMTLPLVGLVISISKKLFRSRRG